MRIIFTEEDGITHTKARYLRGGLLRNYHRLYFLRRFEHVPAADHWFHGLCHKAEIPFPDQVRKAMERFNGGIVFFQNDDRLDFAVDKIPPALRDRAQLFLRNVLPAGTENIDASIRDRTGLLNPFLKPNSARRGPELKRRSCRLSFYGAPTSGKRFTRIDAVRILRKSGLPFTGGLYPIPELPPPPGDVSIDRLCPKEYRRVLSDTRIALVLHGYNPLTFRLFECLSRRCLVLAQDLTGIRFADCGLTAGRHYAAVKQDLSDLEERVRYYLGHPDEAQDLADAGYELFRSHFAFSGVNLPQPLYLEIVRSWKGLDMPQGRRTPRALLVKWLLPCIHSL
jgi:hypothetical protein